MDFIRYYKLEENLMGYTLVLYLDMGLTEFSDEFGSNNEENRDRLIEDIIKRFPNLRINTIRLMVGTMVVATITLQSPNHNFATSARRSFNMSYAYFETSHNLISTIRSTGDVLDVISPTYFDLNPDGSLLITKYFDPSIIKTMQQNGLRVVPFLGNHWDRDVGRAALKNRKLLISQIASTVSKYGLDGIHIDMENLTVEDRDEFVLFIKELREAIPKVKEVSVAVAANPKGYTTGWHGSYDYAKLAQYADYLMIMSYDEHYQGGDSGPVASVQFVEDSIKYALKYVPPSKVVMGLPFFGRYWNHDGSIKGQGTNLIKINELIKKYKGTVFYDQISKSPKAIVNITENEPGFPKGKYIIWYENEDSILGKLQLIDKYNIKGAGSWSLHQATQNIWDVYNKWSKGSGIFIDVEKGWAQGAILAVNEKGWMIGTRDFYFEPDRPLTRAQAASLLVRALNLKMTNAYIPYFEDIPYNHWAKNDIDMAVQNGLMQGYRNQTFAPDTGITREEMAVLLSRILDISPNHNIKNPYKDIKEDRWSYPYVMAISQAEIFEGFEDRTFRPQEKITRAQMAVLLDKIQYKLP